MVRQIWFWISLGLLSVAMQVATRADDVAGVGSEFEQLRQELDLKRQLWASIPWKVTLTEARKAASKQKKPIFMVVNTGNCLGFV